MMNGVNPACVFLLPMLGKRIDEYPRFRDCFLSDDEKHILVYTRVGGNNRNCGFGEEELCKHPNFVETYDDDLDSTYGYYMFSVPEKWQDDFDKIIDMDYDKVSDEYVKVVKSFYPALTNKGTIDRLFSRESEGNEK